MSADSRIKIGTTFIPFEAIPLDCSEPLGNSMSTHFLSNADLSGNLISRRNQTGVLIFCNRAPIVWHSKRQNAVETSMFGSEMMALKNGVELVEALRYKLRMFGAPIEGATNIYYDNEGVYNNCSIPESILIKKHQLLLSHVKSQKRTQRQISVTCSPRSYRVLLGKNYWTDSCTEGEKMSWCFIPKDGLHYALGCGVLFPSKGLYHEREKVVLFLCSEAVESLYSYIKSE